MRVDARQLGPDDPALGQVLALIQQSFQDMEGRIDPPSSMHRLTVAGIAQACAAGEVWAIGAPIVACVFLTPKPGRLYLGKLAVESAARGRGLARILVDLAEARARESGVPLLELETRIELVENHATFARLGFRQVAEGRHEGFDRTTYVVMQRDIV